MEETLTYWQQFVIMHENIRAISWPILLNGGIAVLIFAVLRSVFFYATARKIGALENSSLLIWVLEYMFITFLEEERERYENGSLKRVTLKEAHVLGGLLDTAAWAILGTALIWLWPIVFTVAILFGPIQMSRNHFMRKKIFIAKLKGEDLDV